MENTNTPSFLRALELITSKPESIKKSVDSFKMNYRRNFSDYTDQQIRNLVVDKIISNYSYQAGVVGAGSSVSSLIPGIGTIIATTGGATADLIYCMKLQVEMTMSIAYTYGIQIEQEEEKRICFLIAGLGAINKFTKNGGKTLGTKVFAQLVDKHLKGGVLTAVKGIFKQVSITFTRKSLQKAIPFGIGILVGYGVNKYLTMYVGNQVKGYYQLKKY